MSISTQGSLQRDDATIAYRRSGSGPVLLLLHATLSSSRQLRSLATKLATRFDVISVDRRGSGASVSPRQRALGARPEPIDVAVHIDDLELLLTRLAVGPAIVIGHSYGGCVALELAARKPELVRSVWAYEPPYAPVASPAVQAAMAEVARKTMKAARDGGPPAAAEVFMVGVSGERAFKALSGASRDRVRQAGPSAIADAALEGMDPAGLAHIASPVVIAYGADSEPIYREIAEALCERIPGAMPEGLAGADHMAPILGADIVAAAVEAFADR